MPGKPGLLPGLFALALLPWPVLAERVRPDEGAPLTMFVGENAPEDPARILEEAAILILDKAGLSAGLDRAPVARAVHEMKQDQRPACGIMRRSPDIPGPALVEILRFAAVLAGRAGIAGPPGPADPVAVVAGTFLERTVRDLGYAAAPVRNRESIVQMLKAGRFDYWFDSPTVIRRYGVEHHGLALDVLRTAPEVSLWLHCTTKVTENDRRALATGWLLAVKSGEARALFGRLGVAAAPVVP